MILSIDQIKNLQLAFWQSNINNFLDQNGYSRSLDFKKVTELILKDRNEYDSKLYSYIIQKGSGFYNEDAQKVYSDLYNVSASEVGSINPKYILYGAGILIAGIIFFQK